MSKTNQFQLPTSQKRKKVGAQHVVIWSLITVVFFFLCQIVFVPRVVSQFVLPLFQPSGEQKVKMGFAHFEGLVWASTAKDKEAQSMGMPVKKDLINKEFVFDFTFANRTDEENGYVKAPSEFYLKADRLGENPLFIEPWIGFSLLSFVVSIAFASLITITLPDSIGLLALLFDRQIDETKIKLRLQTGFSDEIIDFLTLPESRLLEIDRDSIRSLIRKIWDRTITEEEDHSKQIVQFEDVYDENVDVVVFRNLLLQRIKEIFSDFLVKEIEDTISGLEWRKNHMKILKGLRLYMAHHFTEKYSNNVQAMAYGGASILIVSVGIRGLKLIPAARPSLIMASTFLEFSMLALLAFTLFYTEEEERMDKMMKKMEDANRSQLDTLLSQKEDIHQLAEALIGQTAEVIKGKVEKAVSEYLTSDDQIKRALGESIMQNIEVSFRRSAMNNK